LLHDAGGWWQSSEGLTTTTTSHVTDSSSAAALRPQLFTNASQPMETYISSTGYTARARRLQQQ